MTNEEMERGIEFLLKSQANFEAQLVQTSQQLEILARTQTEFAQFVRSNLEAQSELNQSILSYGTRLDTGTGTHR